MRVFKSNHRRLYQLAFSWDGAFLYATSDDTTRWGKRGVDRWELGGSGVAEKLGGIPVQATDFCPLPDGDLIVGGHRTSTDDAACLLIVAVVDPTGVQPPWELPRCRFPTRISVSPAGNRFLAHGVDWGRRATLLSYRLPLRPPVLPEWSVRVTPLTDGYSSWLAGFEFEPSGERVWSLEVTSFVNVPGKVAGRWRSADTGKPLGKPIPITGDLTVDTRLAATGDRLIGYSRAAMTSLDLTGSTPKPVRVVNDTRKHFTGLAVHPDGRRVFATCNDETVREYDAVTLHELRAYAWKVGKLRCLAVAPDGLTAAAGSDTGKVVVWDLA